MRRLSGSSRWILLACLLLLTVGCAGGGGQNTEQQAALQQPPAADPQLLAELGKHGPDSFCDAAERGQTEVVRVMLANGWDVAMTDEWGRQPLHCAALRGFADLVRLLLEAGAPLDQHDKLYNGAPIGWALHGAIEMPAEDGNYLSVVEQIVAAGGLDFANDRAWAERPVFGKIRYMNDRGLKRKFDIEAYVAWTGTLRAADRSKVERRRLPSAAPLGT